MTEETTLCDDCDHFFPFYGSWVKGEPPEDALKVNVQVRYKTNEVKAHIELLQDGFVEVKLSEHIPDITPGQSAVFYNGEVCLGGGVIQS